MLPDLDGDIVRLSDKELLDAIEKLLRVPGFIDLCLGYDPASGAFYAGEEEAGGLREVLRRVLNQNRPTGLSLIELIGHACAVRRDQPETAAPEASYAVMAPRA